ncbi:hypothetical protein MUK42_16927 [Musa troglodytarum]|uniref:C2 NT-type domain-containing protein n=1 Tax=Musa troglodytarum TaxID=320322 RepID=A0A9E7KTS4_9LILI|nr:hypothetical protein MUK42_16927 [Musa troglodytarum]
MVARMMRWRPWSLLQSKRYEMRLVVRRIEGLPETGSGLGVRAAAVAEVRWKGPKTPLSSLRRGGVRRNRTREEEVREGGVVEWDEEFLTACTLSAHKENGSFLPWEIAFAVFTGLSEGPKIKACMIGMASVNLAEFAPTAEQKEMEIDVPLLPMGIPTESQPTLYLALSLLELRTIQEQTEAVQSSIVPVPSSPPLGDAFPCEKDEPHTLKSGLRKVNILKALALSRKAKKAYQEDCGNEEKCSPRNDDAEHAYPCNTDSLDDVENVEENKDDFSERKSFSYGTLASANYIEGSFYSDMMTNTDYDDLVYYSHQNSDVSNSDVEDVPSISIPEHHVYFVSKRSIIPWKKTRLNFRSPKAKGEPLLKKSYGEEGGDDIDFDRRQLCSVGGLTCAVNWYDNSVANCPAVSDFGDDNFVVGSWEPKEVISRDGSLKLCTQAFLASIDQRSEQASGESACTVLVAVIADWFQANPHMMPIKSQFDNLIREGSLDWRTLCKNQTYREHFPDKHFDLETVLEAKIRPLSIVPAKSFVGFFHPEGTDDSDSFNFLHGAMSFDNIWDEINRTKPECSSDCGPHIYIVSWNDHFFILKVEHDAYYIIDTLGERLHEGCNQAYILKFDDTTTIHKHKNESRPACGNVPDAETQVQHNDSIKQGKFSGEQEIGDANMEDELICRGQESCKEYIKSFLAAIPVRELQVDLRKGLTTSTLIHHRLQIEFHYTELSKDVMAKLFQPASEPTGEGLHLAVSDSEFLCSVESVFKASWTREATADLSLPVESAAEPSWPVEPAVTFFLTPSVNLEVEGFAVRSPEVKRPAFEPSFFLGF